MSLAWFLPALKQDVPARPVPTDGSAHAYLVLDRCRWEPDLGLGRVRCGSGPVPVPPCTCGDGCVPRFRVEWRPAVPPARCTCPALGRAPRGRA